MTAAAAPTLDAVLDRILAGRQGRPASERELAGMDRAAPVPATLRALYARDAELFVPGFELFEPAIYQDVNTDRAAFGELADVVYFADDQAGGFYFLDPDDLLGLGAEYVYWVDRGLMAADEVVPVAPSLAEALDRLSAGADPSTEPRLGQRALSRLARALDDLPPGVDARPGVDRAEFRRAREERGVHLTFATGEVMTMADGLYFAASGRQIHPLSSVSPAAEGRLAVVGHDPARGHLAVTRGDWQDLPADRLIAFTDPEHPERGELLGRYADVLTYWIEEARTS
jgi:hypothetical protein